MQILLPESGRGCLEWRGRLHLWQSAGSWAKSPASCSCQVTLVVLSANSCMSLFGLHECPLVTNCLLQAQSIPQPTPIPLIRPKRLSATLLQGGAGLHHVSGGSTGSPLDLPASRQALGAACRVAEGRCRHAPSRWSRSLTMWSTWASAAMRSVSHAAR